MDADWFVLLRLAIYLMVVLFITVIVAWFELVPGNGARVSLRLLVLPSLATWLALLFSTVSRAMGAEGYAPFLFMATAVYTIISLAFFVWRKKK